MRIDFHGILCCVAVRMFHDRNHDLIDDLIMMRRGFCGTGILHVRINNIAKMDGVCRVGGKTPSHSAVPEKKVSDCDRIRAADTDDADAGLSHSGSDSSNRILLMIFNWQRHIYLHAMFLHAAFFNVSIFVPYFLMPRSLIPHSLRHPQE